MANRHFAELGDLWKHLLLAEILRLRPPAHYWETHAGSATYALTESPTRLHGAIRFLSVGSSDPELKASSYMGALLSTPGRYPGSPALAMRALGGNASYLFCDFDAESVQSLEEAGENLRVRVRDFASFAWTRSVVPTIRRVWHLQSWTDSVAGLSTAPFGGSVGRREDRTQLFRFGQQPEPEGSWEPLVEAEGVEREAVRALQQVRLFGHARPICRPGTALGTGGSRRIYGGRVLPPHFFHVLFTFDFELFTYR
jgi:hypothetical protein